MYFREDVFLMFTILENHYKTRFVSTLDEITEMFFNNKVLTHSVTKQEIIQLYIKLYQTTYLLKMYMVTLVIYMKIIMYIT